MSDLARLAERRNVRRYTKNAQRMRKAFGAASGPEGRALVQRHVDRLTEWIKADRAKAPKIRQRRSLTIELAGLLRDAPDEELAQAALAGVVNATRRPSRDDDKGPGRIAKEIIGQEIERAVRGYYLRTEHPKLFAKVQRAAAHKATLNQRLAAERKKLREAGLKIAWKGEQRLLAGNWGFDACLQALRDVIVERRDGKERVPAIAEGAWPTGMMQWFLENRPIAVPVYELPEPWTEFENADGAPFLLGCRDEDAARAANMRPHMDAVSFLQSMPLTIDGFMLDFVQGLASWNHIPLIGRGMKDRGPREVLRWDLEQAEILRGKTFYLPLACEWRGRIQPIPYFNYARADHIRSLFRFKHGARIGERGIWWLKVSTANCFNEGGRITRLPFEERVQWVDENLERIRLIADDPRLGLKYLKPANEAKLWLEEAADPFQFIAHARELVAAIDEGPDYTTTLPLPLDASNSGAQHYAILARDPDGATLTNLTFDGDIHCLYTEVGKIINSNFAVLLEEGSKADIQRVNYWVSQKATDRKLMKGLTVPYLYGQRESKAQVKLLDILADREENRIFDGFAEDYQVKWRRPKARDIPHRAWFVRKHREAIATAFPGFEPIRNFFRDCAALLAERREVLRWTSPSGVPVCNRYNKSDPHQKSYYLGATRVRHKQAYVFRPELDRNGCARGAAPNLVHSLDAAHLAFVALACEADSIPLLTVHDCFATLGCHTDATREIWLRKFVAMYENTDVLKQVYDCTRRHGTPPPIPPPLGLELNKVNGPYALS
jgi:DNA-dependent RNA polymerase